MGRLSFTAGQTLKGGVQENVSNAPPSEIYGASSGYDGIEDQYPGLINKGNLDLTNRQMVQFQNGLDETNATPDAIKQTNPEDFPPGSYGSEYSATIQDGPYNTVIPTIYDGKLHSTAEAEAHYRLPPEQGGGQHMGQFLYSDDGKDYRQSEAYTNALHLRPITVKNKPYHGGKQ